MPEGSDPIARMALQLARLPGIGQKSAQRLAYHIAGLPLDQVKDLAAALWQGRKALRFCARCGNYTQEAYLSLNKSSFDEDTDREVIEQLDLDTGPDPLETITQKETYQNIELKMSEVLSDFEQKVFNEYLNGESYVDIATKLNSHVKAVDNAIQRIKKKVEKHIAEDDRI